MARSATFRAKNNTGAVIPAGSLIYISGFSDTAGQPTIGLASYDDSFKLPCAGVVREDVAIGEANVLVRTGGTCPGFDTEDLDINTDIYVGLNGGVVYRAPDDDDPTAITQRIGVTANQEAYPNGTVQLLSLELNQRISHPKIINVEDDQHHNKTHSGTHFADGTDPFIHAQQHSPGGADPLPFVSEKTEAEHHQQTSNAIQTILKDLDGYSSTEQEHYQQISDAVQIILKDLDGYSVTTEGADGYITFFTGPKSIAGDNDLYWDRSNNRLGIGTIDPETLLELSSTVPYITLHNSTHEDGEGGRKSQILFKGEQSGGEETTLAKIQASHDGTADDQKGDLIFYTNDGSDSDSPTEAMRIDSSGNIGIGDSNPTYNLDVKNAGGNVNARLTAANGNDSYLTLVEDAGNDLQYGGMLKLDGGTNNFEIGTIDTDVEYPAIYMTRGISQVGIGSAAATNIQLGVSADIANGYAAYFFNDGNNSNRNGIGIKCGQDVPGISYSVLCFDGDGGHEGGLRINAGTVEVYQSSDESLKEQIALTKINAMDIINKINLIEYRKKAWPKSAGKNPIGFSAQNCQQAFPRMVAKDPSADTLNVAPTALIPVLVKAIQEQDEIIKDLIVKVKALKGV